MAIHGDNGAVRNYKYYDLDDISGGNARIVTREYFITMDMSKGSTRILVPRESVEILRFSEYPRVDSRFMDYDEYLEALKYTQRVSREVIFAKRYDLYMVIVTVRRRVPFANSKEHYFYDFTTAVPVVDLLSFGDR